jgi:hypothetical protein
MTPKLPWFGLLLLCLWGSRPAFSQNICLDFDGVDDYVHVNNLPLGNTDFTVEMWFASNTGNVQARELFSLDESGVIYYVYTNAGYLYMAVLSGAPSGAIQLSSQLVNDATWRHLAIVRQGNVIQPYLNGIPLAPVNLSLSFNSPEFRLSTDIGSNTSWWGYIDDVRVWNFAKTPQQVNEQKKCVPNEGTAGLQLYLTFDEGTPNGNNPPFTSDYSGNTNSAILYNFGLIPVTSPTIGQASNFVTSTAPMIYPALHDLKVKIKDYPYQNNLLTEICNGDPVHFSLTQSDTVPAPNPDVKVRWFYRDGGAAPVPLKGYPWLGYKFPVPTDSIDIDCANSTDGFVDRTFYAVSTVTDPVSGDSCDYKSDDYLLRICCPLSPATVTVFPSAICEGEQVSINVALNSPDPYVQNPGPLVTIDWFFNGNPLPAYQNQTSFSYLFSSPSNVGGVPTDFCFEARVSNCGSKSILARACITVDPQPVCGTIAGWPLPAPLNLTLVSTTPHLTYEICPGNDAQLGIDQPFLYCIPQWQFSFDQITWSSSLGMSNSVQNTNILPSYLWPPGATSIYYRIQCNPLSNPSGCDPCYSDMVEIRLQGAPPANSIVGQQQVCKGDLNTLSVANPNAAHTYTWLCDGLPVATGPTFSYTAVQSACYWVETSDGNCYVVESPQFCVEVCEVVPILSCPLTPNECACLGDPITLSACDSYSTCAGQNLQYTWYIDGVQQSSSACFITHTPPAVGATYRVEITDLTTGCTAATERTIVPCDKVGSE